MKKIILLCLMLPLVVSCMAQSQKCPSDTCREPAEWCSSYCQDRIIQCRVVEKQQLRKWAKSYKRRWLVFKMSPKEMSANEVLNKIESPNCTGHIDILGDGDKPNNDDIYIAKDSIVAPYSIAFYKALFAKQSPTTFYFYKARHIMSDGKLKNDIVFKMIGTLNGQTRKFYYDVSDSMP